jgi:hypothetical protein
MRASNTETPHEIKVQKNIERNCEGNGAVSASCRGLSHRGTPTYAQAPPVGRREVAPRTSENFVRIDKVPPLERINL